MDSKENCKYDIEADALAKKLVGRVEPFLPSESSDVRDEYDAGEFVAAADGAIHDLGFIRADLPDEAIELIELLIERIKEGADAWNARFVGRMEIGLRQLKERRGLMRGEKKA